MNTYPDIDQDNPAYAKELARHLESPRRMAIFEVFWNGTGQYQRILARDGFSAKQELLGHLHAEVLRMQEERKALDQCDLLFAQQEQTSAARRVELSSPEYLERNTVTGRLYRPDNGVQIADAIKRESVARAERARCEQAGGGLDRQIAMYKSAADRLTAALALYYREQVAADTAPVPPVINVTVAPPEVTVNVDPPVVNVEATLPPLDIAVTATLPARKTELVVHRTKEGEITGSTAIETTIGE